LFLSWHMWNQMAELSFCRIISKYIAAADVLGFLFQIDSEPSFCL
jgi:hypothetical protein